MPCTAAGDNQARRDAVLLVLVDARQFSKTSMSSSSAVLNRDGTHDRGF